MNKRHFMTIEEIKTLIDIQQEVIGNSNLLDQQTRDHFSFRSKYIFDFIKSNVNFNAIQKKSLISEVLLYWNETINADAEVFWERIKKAGFDLVRKEPLRYALTKGRFRSVEHGIDARVHWGILRDLPTIKERYSPTEIQQIDEIINEDEKRRIAVLQNCLDNNRIAPTMYLKFGECMAYAMRCKLINNYFSEAQVEDLQRIWREFDAK